MYELKSCDMWFESELQVTKKYYHTALKEINWALKNRNEQYQEQSAYVLNRSAGYAIDQLKNLQDLSKRNGF